MSLRIDAHHHLWNLDVTPQPWLSDSMAKIDRSFLLPDLTSAVGRRIDRTVIVQTASDEAETLWMLDQAERSELIGAVVGWVDLTAPDVGERPRLAALPNVRCKLSGMVTEADWTSWTVDDLRPYVEVILDTFGGDRVMFGSDWPVCLLAASYTEVHDAAQTLLGACTDSEDSAAFGGTARRVYRMEEPA